MICIKVITRNFSSKIGHGGFNFGKKIIIGIFMFIWGLFVTIFMAVNNIIGIIMKFLARVTIDKK